MQSRLHKQLRILKQLIALFLLLSVMSGCQKEPTQPPSPFVAWGFSLDGFPISETKLSNLQEETKIGAQIIQFYLQWPSSPTQFQEILPSLEVIHNFGALPCMTWEPMIVLSDKEEAIPFNTILNGNYDVYLIRMAEGIKKWNRPIIIRIAQEMNLKRYHWGTTQEQYGPMSPEIYKKIFIYIVDLFRKRDVSNVSWAFCPNVESDPNASWNQAKHYYPGDAYVDLLGMDGYNWAISPEIARARKSDWIKPSISFEELFHHIYRELKAISPNKPIVVFETAAASRNNEQKKIWIQNALMTAKNWRLLGIIWFQVKKEEDWRIPQNEDTSYVPLIENSKPPFDWILSQIKK